MSTKATDWMFFCAAKAIARLTATVVVPTPPLLPNICTIRPFLTVSFSSAFSLLCLNLSKAWSNSSFFSGWGKNSFAPALKACKITEGSELLDVKKISPTTSSSSSEWMRLNSLSVSPPSSKIRRSGRRVSPLLWTLKPSTDRRISSNASLRPAVLASILALQLLSNI